VWRDKFREENFMNEINVRTQTDRQLVIQWLSAFESALTSGSEAALSAVLSDEVHWRDLMAFTWTITPHDTR
jgi:putative flavoprotein involved in K+ transport